MADTVNTADLELSGVGNYYYTDKSQKELRLAATSNIFRVAKDGSVSSNSITLTAQKILINGTVTFTSNPSVTLTTTGDNCELTYANLGTNNNVVITASVTDTADGITYTDTFTVIKVLDGSDTVNYTLSNEACTVPANVIGQTTSYAGTGTTIEVYEGSQKLTYVTGTLTNSSFSISTAVTPSGKLTVNTITGANTTTATVPNHSGLADDTDFVTVTYTITARRSNGTNITLTATQNITKTRSGLNFSDAKVLFSDTTFANGTNSVIVYNNTANSTAVTITREAAQTDSPFINVSAYNLKIVTSAATGSSPQLGGFIQVINSRANAVFVQRFVAKVPIGYTLELASNAIGTGSTQKWLTSQAGTGNFEEYLLLRKCGPTGTFDTAGHIYINGTQTFPITWYLAFATVYDLTAPSNLLTSARLSRDSVVLPADSDGVVTTADYATAASTFNVYNGNTLDTSNWTVSFTTTGGISGSLSGSTYTVSDMTSDIGTVVFSATRSGYDTLSSTFTVTKARRGIGGTNAAYVIVTPATDQVFKYLSGATTPTNGTTLTFSAALYGGLSAYQWQYYNGSAWVDFSGATSSTFTIGHTGTDNFASAWGTKTALSIRCKSGNSTDELTIVKLYDATNGTSPLIYDIVTSAPIIAKDAVDAATNGTHTSITIQGKKYDGNTTSNYGWVTVTANGATEGATATDTATTPVTLSPTNTDGKTSYTIKLYNQAQVSGATLLDTQTIPVVFKGATGINGAAAITAVLSNETHVFSASSTGNVTVYTGSGTTIRVYEGATELTYDEVGTSNSTWKVTKDANNITAGAITVTSGYATVAQASGFDLNDSGTITYTITGKNSAGTSFTITKTQTFSKSKTGISGTSAVSGYLTNEAHTIPASSTGTVQTADYTPAGGTFKVYNGVTDVTTSSTFSVVGTPTGIIAAIGNTTGVYTLSTMTVDATTVTFRATYGTTTIDKVYSITKARTGSTGQRGNITIELATTQTTWNVAVETQINTYYTNNYSSTKILNDRVTVYNTSAGFSQTRYWDGSTWIQAASVVDGNLIVTGTVTSDKLAANSITANKITVGAQGNCINDDPMFADTTAWTTNGNITFTSDTTASGAVANTYVQCANASVTDRMITSAKRYPIGPGKLYRLSANVYAATGNDRNMYLFVEFYDNSGTYITGATTTWGASKSGYTYGGQPPTGVFTRVGAQFGTGTGRLIPSNARYCEIGVWFQYSGGNPTSSVLQAAQDLRLEECITGELVVDGSIKAAKIDATGLTIRRADGSIILQAGGGPAVDYSNVGGTTRPADNATVGAQAGVNLVDSSGTVISSDAIKNNLATVDWWKRDATIPWSENSEYNRIIQVPTDQNILGPKGGADFVWYAQEITGDSNPGGGWNNGTHTLLDTTKTYRFVVPIRRLSGTAGIAYWGTNNVCDINTQTVNGNPYFSADRLPQTDRWYLFVGYVFPYGSTGNTSDTAGIWDCKTGQKFAAGNNWNFGTTGNIQHRAYQFYASLDSAHVFGRPLINLVDGSEPALREYFEPGAVLNNNITVVNGAIQGIGAGAGTTVDNNSITVSNGVLQGTGTPNVVVDNTYQQIGQNLIPNSDQTVAMTWQRGYTPNGTVISHDIRWASLETSWNTSNYVLSGSLTRNVFARQAGVATGTEDGSGNSAVAADFYPMSTDNSKNRIAVVPGERVCFSCYVTTHRCDYKLFVTFSNAAGTGIAAYDSQQYNSTGSAANTLSAYTRAQIFVTVPAGAATATVFVRKYNTYAGNDDSYIWFAAPQFEKVAANATTPSPYMPGPVATIDQLAYIGALDATKNNLYRQTTAPTGGTYTTGDLWIDTDSSPTVVYQWTGSAWAVISNLTTNTNQLTDGAGLGTTAVWANVSGTGRPVDNATRNVIYRQASAPAGGTYTTGDLWIDTDSSPTAVYQWNGSTWAVISNLTTNTNELTDGAGLGTTAVWANVSGTGRPADNANNTYVDANGTIQGVSSGAGTVVNNSLITLSTLGLQTFRVVSRGADSVYSIGAGIYGNNILQFGADRSYVLIRIRRSDAVITFNQIYDVYGDGATTSGRNAQTLANDLNATTSDYVVVVYTYDEPQTNRTTALRTAMYRCGASPAVFGALDFKFRSAYALIGIAGSGQGNGAEFYQGAVDNDVNAWIDASFNILNGQLVGVSAGYTPSTLRDYGYTGASDATRNVMYRQASAPTGGTYTTGDLWIDTDSSPTATYQWTGSAWSEISNLTTNTNQLTDGAGLGTTAVWGNVTGTGRPVDNATRNVIYRQTTAPTGGTYTTGDLWIDTDSSPTAVYQWTGSAWAVISNLTTNTNQLTDGALLGQTAIWSSVSGTGRPADNANNTYVDGNGTIQGVSSGAGTVVNNGLITLSDNGTLNNAGGGQIKTLPVIDRRNTNEAPSWYPVGLTEEFKTRTAIGAPGISTYGILRTEKGWADSSGGAVIQTFKSQEAEYKRASVSGNYSQWTAWQVKIDQKISQDNIDRFMEPNSVDSQYIGNNLQSDNYVANTSGWKIVRNTGAAEFSNVFIRGKVEANEGYFKGNITGATGTFEGSIKAGSINLDEASGSTTRYYANASVTVPTGMTNLKAILVGGGGGGASGNNGAGGGGGGGTQSINIPVVAGQILTLVVGAGGAVDQNGGATTLTYNSTTYTAGGGYKGIGLAAGAGGTGTTSGIAGSNGAAEVTFTGSYGGVGITSPAIYGAGGNSGDNWGEGGRSGTGRTIASTGSSSNGAGTAGSLYGGGGAGNAAGAAGFVILEFVSAGVRLTTLANGDGTKTVPVNTIIEGTAKAWIRFDGDVTGGSVKDSFNISSISNVSTGIWTINFANAMPDANYVLVGSAGGRSNHHNRAVSIAWNVAPTTTAVRIHTGMTGGVSSVGMAENSSYTCIAIFS